MKCILMNKNKEVLVARYDKVTKGFNQLYEVLNIEYAPLILKHLYNQDPRENKMLEQLTEWFKGRGIPSWRDDVDLLLAKLNVSTPSELLDKAFGLSLSDQYWVKPYDKKIEYKDINFLEHDFEDSDFTNATFSNTMGPNTKISLISPNNTTDGRLKKTWVIEDGKRYLLKGGYKSEVMQPFNEVISSMICERLGFRHALYTIHVVKDKVVSKCECFIDKNTELITAYQILHNNCDKDKAYESYIKILESNGIVDAREEVENMFILDYIMLNEDRHLNNFGVIRNVETLNWISVAPIFDTGQSLNILDYNDEELIINGDGSFFYNVSDFDTIINFIQDIERFDLSRLDGLCEEVDKLLHEYKNITKMTDRRIDKICTLLYNRINKLREVIKTK